MSDSNSLRNRSQAGGLDWLDLARDPDSLSISLSFKMKFHFEKAAVSQKRTPVLRLELTCVNSSDTLSGPEYKPWGNLIKEVFDEDLAMPYGENRFLWDSVNITHVKKAVDDARETLSPEADARLASVLDGNASDCPPRAALASADPGVSQHSFDVHPPTRRCAVIEELWTEIYGGSRIQEHESIGAGSVPISAPNTTGLQRNSSPRVIGSRATALNPLPMFYIPSSGIYYVTTNGVICGYFDGGAYYSLVES